MIKILGLCLILSLSSSVYANVCNTLQSIEGFTSTSLFEKAIINNTPLDYKVFYSRCNINCLLNSLKLKRVSYKLDNPNISIFNANSVATLVIEKRSNDSFSGYLLCSTNQKRRYLKLPIKLDMNKVSLDLQTEDYRSISRTLNIQGSNKRYYQQIIKRLNKISNEIVFEVGFDNFKLKSNKNQTQVKISKLSPQGDFIIVLEQFK